MECFVLEDARDTHTHVLPQASSVPLKREKTGGAGRYRNGTTFSASILRIPPYRSLEQGAPPGNKAARKTQIIRKMNMTEGRTNIVASI